jgi:hypothetical protein
VLVSALLVLANALLVLAGAENSSKYALKTLKLTNYMSEICRDVSFVLNFCFALSRGVFEDRHKTELINNKPAKRALRNYKASGSRKVRSW